jgi:hypothetical protein
MVPGAPIGLRFALSPVKRSRRRIEATAQVGGFSIIAFCVFIVPGARGA